MTYITFMKQFKYTVMPCNRMSVIHLHYHMFKVTNTAYQAEAVLE